MSIRGRRSNARCVARPARRGVLRLTDGGTTPGVERHAGFRYADGGGDCLPKGPKRDKCHGHRTARRVPVAMCVAFSGTLVATDLQHQDQPRR